MSEEPVRIWLAGSRSFGAAALRALGELPNVEIVAVTAPAEDPLAEAARERGLPVHEEVPAERVREARAEVIVSAQNYAFIGPEARAAARYGAIGYHPSLLPRHRGRRSIEHTIEQGDPIAGGTIFRMDDGWDTGPIVAQEFCHVVPGWGASELWREELFPLGIRLLTRVIAEGPPWEGRPQDERVATEAN